MDEDEPGEGLDDLRKKRLAYYQTLNNSRTEDLKHGHTIRNDCSVESVSAIKEQQNVYRSNDNSTHNIEQRSHHHISKISVVETDMQTNSSYSSHMVNDNKTHWKNDDKETENPKTVPKPVSTNEVLRKQDNSKMSEQISSPSQHPLKTSSFFVPNPEHEPNKSYEKTGNNSDGLDAYNETVERLIKATKEEILGMKVSDNIWTNFRKDKTELVDEEVHIKKNEKLENTELHAEFNTQSTPTTKIARNFRRSFSESGYSIQKDLNDNMLKGHEQSNREHRSSFSNSTDARPMYSQGGPTQKFYQDTAENRKSFNTSKIEEIFSSRQVVHSQAVHDHVFMHESQEFEPMTKFKSDLPQKSNDFSELGLSTHRPDSERKDMVHIEADDINLGDTVTKEMRTLLGEEKFNQFLMKAKKDIDDLHNDRSSESSGRKEKTPRLVKDKSIKPQSNHTFVSEPKTDMPKSILKTKESEQKIETGSKHSARKQRSLSESKDKHSSVHDSTDFTPRQPDGQVVENLIGEYLLTKEPLVNQSLTSNPAYKNKNIEEKSNEVKDNVKDSIPALNLDDLTKSDSPRPKLNRPKYEPPTIYQERSNKEENHQEKKVTRDMNLTNSKNYEQVTVPRNVAFSSNEIYNQAYGAFNPGQEASMIHYFHGGSVIHQPYSSPPGTATNVPVTPTTPVGPSFMPQSFHNSDQFTYQASVINSTSEMNSYKSFSRQASYGSERSHITQPTVQQHIPHPPSHQQIAHQPGPQGIPISMAYSSTYASSADPRDFAPPGIARFTAPIMPNDQHFHTPHPPQPAMSISGAVTQANIPVPYSNIHGVPFSHPYQYPVGIDQNMAGMGVHPHYMQVGGSGQMFIPHPPTSLGAQVYRPGHTTHKIHEVKDEESQHPPPTPTTSNVEVQTDREELISNDKVTMVEESTFTSVSQIVDEDKFIPHPPAKKREGGPSPRRPHHSKDVTQKKTQDAKRHIDGIRQHHEQRRQQYEGEKLSEDQIIERQKKFAKASLDRYFSSLENIYSSSSKVSGINSETNLPVVEDEDDMDVPNETSGEVEHVEHVETVIDDVLSNVQVDPQVNLLKSEVPEEKTKTNNDFKPVVHGFVDFSESKEIRTTEKAPDVKSFEFEDKRNDFENESKEYDNETLVNSMANTDATLNAGGLTERLNELGIDVSHVKHSNKDKKQISKDKKHGGKKGKVLIVCPDCGGLNKEYMSWCTQCGEMIIGIEPMLVSKNRDGKIRMKPLDKSEVAIKEEIRIKNPEEKEIDTRLASYTNEVNYVQEVDEKPFTLNLDGIKSEKEEHTEVYEGKKVSPNKSEGRDSGRPSSDDPDLELQTQKIEEEVVNDICASISDPVLKGYMKSHFSKSKTLHDSEGKFEKHHCDNDLDMFKGTVETKNIKNFENYTHHDVVNFGFENKCVTSDVKANELDVRFSKEEIRDKHSSDEVYNSTKYETGSEDDTVQAKIAMFNQKQFKSNAEKEHHKNETRESFTHIHKEEILFEAPPLPNFSSTHPVSHNELKLKLPANSMDYSTDMSQVVSQNFDNTNNVNEKGDNIAEEDEEEVEERERQKAERRKERRRKRGHGAIDVEVFGYEESRESRNSSRANRMVPLLNLAGNSSDEDDSVLSDPKPDKQEVQDKQEVKQTTSFASQVKSSMNAWGPAVIQEESPEEEKPWQQPIREENKYLNDNSLLWKQNGLSADHERSTKDTSPQANTENMATDSSSTLEIVSVDRDQEFPVRDNEEWKQLFDPSLEVQEEAQEPVEVVDDVVEGNQPFLMQLINQPKPQKSKKKPTSARGKSVKSKVRQSIEEPGYQRKWSRSSTAWSSYNQGELNTSSSLRSSSEMSKTRPTSAPKSRFHSSLDLRASGERNSSNASLLGQRKRPGSAPKSRVLSSDMQASNDSDIQASSYQDVSITSPSKVRDKLTRPTSAPKSRTAYSDLQTSFNIDLSKISGGRKVPVNQSQPHNEQMQASVDNDDYKMPDDVDDLADEHDDKFEQTTPQTIATPEKKVRPFSSDTRKRKIQKKKSKKMNDLDLELDLVNDMVEHRLPKPSAMDRLSELMASPRSTYDKYIEMTPRIQAGTVSRWQCLPDEILIHVFSYLDQSSLTKCAQVCHQYYRVAMDESLWKYITIKKNDIDDSCLEEIAKRHPVSLALIQCQGERVTAKALRDLFRECAQSLKELNIARCSRGALNGDSLLLHAAARCHNLTHIDASWCSLTDSGLMAISNSCNRLESLCINGCSAISNDGLETVMKKHGSHLRVLEMFGCFNLSPRGLRSVANNCINLITLNLGQCYKLTDSCISQLSTSLGRVEWLDLRGCKQIKDNCMRRIVKNCPRLKHLSLANCPNITDVSILEISTYLTDIRSVDLCGCKNITDGSIRALVNTCTNLRQIDISSTNCTHRSVSMIANFSGQRLETLKINFLSDVTEQSLIKLAKHCRRLQTVHMYGCTSIRNIEKVKEERPTFTIEM